MMSLCIYIAIYNYVYIYMGVVKLCVVSTRVA